MRILSQCREGIPRSLSPVLANQRHSRISIWLADELMTQVWNAKPGTHARTGVVHNGEIRTLSIDVDT